MRIIAFDLGQNMAYAHNAYPNKLARGSKSFPNLERAHRLAAIMQWLQIDIQWHLLDAVIYETPFARGRDATRSLWGTAGLIEAIASSRNLPVVDAAVPTIKKFATGSGRGSKEEMIAAAKGFGYKGDNEHEADAVCLLRYAEANLERITK